MALYVASVTWNLIKIYNIHEGEVWNSVIERIFKMGSLLYENNKKEAADILDEIFQNLKNVD